MADAKDDLDELLNLAVDEGALTAQVQSLQKELPHAPVPPPLPITSSPKPGFNSDINSPQTQAGLITVDLNSLNANGVGNLNKPTINSSLVNNVLNQPIVKPGKAPIILSEKNSSISVLTEHKPTPTALGAIGATINVVGRPPAPANPMNIKVEPNPGTVIINGNPVVTIAARPSTPQTPTNQRNVAPRLVINTTRPIQPGKQIQMVGGGNFTIPSNIQLPQGPVIIQHKDGTFLLTNGPGNLANINLPLPRFQIAPRIQNSPIQSPRNIAPPTVVVAPPRAVAPAPQIISKVQLTEEEKQEIQKFEAFLQNLIDLVRKSQAERVDSVVQVSRELLEGKRTEEDYIMALSRLTNSNSRDSILTFLKKVVPIMRRLCQENRAYMDKVLGLNKLGPIHAVAQGIRPNPNGMVTSGTPIRPATIQQAQQIHHPAMDATVRMHLPLQVGGMRMQHPNLGFMIKTEPQPVASRDVKSNYQSRDVDDDINDVAAMGGVNLSEEKACIFAGAEEIINQPVRSCKDEYFLVTDVLRSKIHSLCQRSGVSEVAESIVGLISHATQERLRALLEKLNIVAEHRTDISLRLDDRYEICNDVKSQLKFLTEVEKVERKRKEEQEKEMLLRMAKSRAKHEDPEHQKLVKRAKEIERIESEKSLREDANRTAMAAIGSRKRKIDEAATNGSVPLKRQRIKRVAMRDLVFILEEEKQTNHSPLLLKAYFK